MACFLICANYKRAATRFWPKCWSSNDWFSSFPQAEDKRGFPKSSHPAKAINDDNKKENIPPASQVSHALQLSWQKKKAGSLGLSIWWQFRRWFDGCLSIWHFLIWFCWYFSFWSHKKKTRRRQLSSSFSRWFPSSFFHFLMLNNNNFWCGLSFNPTGKVHSRTTVRFYFISLVFLIA